MAIKRGWECTIAYGRIAQPGVASEIKVGTRFDTYEHYFENRLFDNEGLASRFATRRLIRKINEIQPDIIHLHNIHDHYLNYKLLFNYLNSTTIQVVWTFHDFWAITGHCHHFIDAKCEKWKTQCDKCPLQHSTVNSFIDRSKRNFELKKRLFTANKNLTIVPVSYWVGEMVKHSFLNEKRIEVIPNGINIELFEKSEQSLCQMIPSDKFVILGVARDWEPGDRKGFDDYLKLSRLLKDDEIIVLVGIKPSQKGLLPSNVVGLERTKNQEELIGIYRSANVLLSLSGAETFGLTIVEANACGIPAVVYNNTAPPLLITEETGYVAKNGSIKDVYNKIECVKNNGRDYYKNNCIKHVKMHYDKNVNYQKYIDLYEDLLSLK